MGWLSFLVLLFSLLGCTPRPETLASRGAPADSAAGGSPIFREIDISPFGKVALGARFTQHSATVVRVSDGLFALESGAGHFANTDSILVRVDKDNRVRALYFVYRAGTDFDASVSEYVRSLGEPDARAVTDSAGRRLERAVWQDQRTRFEVTGFGAPGAQPRVTSAMFDRTTSR